MQFRNEPGRRRILLLLLPMAMLAVILVLALQTTKPSLAADPGSDSIGPAGPTVTWVGTATGGSSPSAEDTCVEGINCDTFTLNVSGSTSDWTGKNVSIVISWTNSTIDYDLYVHKGSNAGPLVGSSASGGSTEERTSFAPSTAGVGAYTVHVVYFAAVGTADQYHGTASVIIAPGGGGGTPSPSATAGSGPPARYANYYGPTRIPGELEGAEPSVGVNWLSGKIMYIALLHALQVSVNQCQVPAKLTFVDTYPNQIVSNRESLDPILYTDNLTGRTFISQLTGAGSAMEFTDDDGATYTPSEGAHLNPGPDHQTIGAGPYRPGTPITSTTGYPHAVYYCSQGVVEAACARSDNGGLTFNNGSPIYTIAECGTSFGLHGHVKVAPDGTVYVPKPACDGTAATNKQIVTRSLDNGLTWQVLPVTGSTDADARNQSDPSIGIAGDGTVYIGMQNGDGRALASVSTDRGEHWSTPVDVGAQLGVRSINFPEVVAGDGDRAAFAFIGTTTPGDYSVETFPGEWHLYIAHTYDRGQSWITTDATPNDPVQRRNICGSGACRNLLDFFGIDVDKEGRVVVGYADGCVGPCISNPYPADGSPGFRERVVAIARQTGGRRLFAQYDPADPTRLDPPQNCAPNGTPSVTVTGTPPTAIPTTTGIPVAYTPTSTPTGVAGSPTATPTVCPVQFQDVPPSGEPSSFYPYVRCLACRNVLGGYPCGATPGEPCGSSGNPYFRPGANITRGQIAKIVSNSAGFSEAVSGQTYADVSPSTDPSSFYPFIERLSQREYMGGYACGTTDPRSGPCDGQNRPYFRPANNATRGQLSKIVANTAGFSEDITGQTFADVPASSDPSSYYQYLERLTRRGVMGGYACGTTDPRSGPCDGQNRPYFRPSADVTRAQASKIVANTFFPGCQTPARPGTAGKR